MTGKRTYNGYQLVRATPESEEHLDVLRFIEKGVKEYFRYSRTWKIIYWTSRLAGNVVVVIICVREREYSDLELEATTFRQIRKRWGGRGRICQTLLLVESRQL